MPRDGSGVSSPPPGTGGSPDTTILSAMFNAWVADVTATFNSAWPVALGGTGTTDLAFPDGTIRFKNTTDPTAKLAFDLSGITTATVRTLTVPDASGTIALVNEGSFTPTGTAGENCVAVIPALNYYYRFGNRVTCWGLVTSDPSLAGTSTIFSLSLPIPSDFTNAGELAGIFDSSSEHGRILADTVNNLASFTYVSSGSGPTNFAFNFSYIVAS